MYKNSIVFILAMACITGASAQQTSLNGKNPLSDVGESMEIVERIRLYKRQHGIQGRLTSGDLLSRSHASYGQWLDDRRNAKLLSEPGWVSLGPINGAGRSTSVAPDFSIEGKLTIGAAGGGLWRTEDSGMSWYPLTDGIADLSVGAVAIAPSDPQVIYLGSGEGGIAGDFIPGIGLLRSPDDGQSWFLPGGEEDVAASQFFALSIDPDDADTLFAATNEGLLRTADGGVTWDVIIAPAGLVGVTEVLRSSETKNLMYAAMWCAGMCPEGINRVMRSEDGGISWVAADAGLPAETFNGPIWNRFSLTVAVSDDQILYAGGYSGDDERPVIIYRSDDGGRSWLETDGDCGPYLGGQGWYDNTITLHPSNPDIVIAGGMYYVVSMDAGVNWTVLDPYEGGGEGFGTETIPHVDAHDLQWQGERVWLSCDGGIWFSDDFGLTWTGRNDGLVTRQYYAMDLDPMRPERVLAGTQDNASNLRRDIGDDTWDLVINSDGFECAINPLMPDYMYGTIYGTEIYRSTDGGESWVVISDPIAGETAPFYTPLEMQYATPWVLYTGKTNVWRTADAGDRWTRLSTAVVEGTWSTGVVTAIATTPIDTDVVFVGKGEIVYASDDGGQLWWPSPMASNVNAITISPFDSHVAVACLALVEEGQSQMMKTIDGGHSWFDSGEGLPPFAAHAARWDLDDSNTVYAGTDLGLYRSLDGGRSWERMPGTGLPAASVHDIRLQPGRIVVATHGRGVWELVTEVIENTPPTILIITPVDGESIMLGDSTIFEATAQDVDGDPLQVTWIFGDFWNTADGGNAPGEVTSVAEYSFLRGGEVIVAAHVDDGRGGSAVDQINVTAFDPADDCATPRFIPGAGPFPVSIITENWSATESPSDPDVPCVEEDNDPVAGGWGSLWFEFTPDESATYIVSTCGSVADTTLSAWTGPSCGPYEAVPGGCNDDDSFEHCTGERTDSYLELELDAHQTYRFMAGSWDQHNVRPLRFNVECASFASVETDHLYFVPAAAHAEGDNATLWKTDLSIYNPEFTAVNASISLQPGGFEPIEVVLQAGTAVSYPDVVAQIQPAGGSGALRIEATGDVIISSRTYNDTPGGTFGQGIPGFSAAEAVVGGGAARLFGLISNDDFRTNIGIANLGAEPVDIRVELFNQTGDELAAFNDRIASFGWKQFNRVFERESLSGIASAFAIVRNNSATGAIMVYASVVDEFTGDPTYISATAVASEGTNLWVPAVAHIDGVGSSDWRTDLVLGNIGALSLGAVVEFLPSNESNYDAESVTAYVAANNSRSLDDVVAESFSSVGTGALRISAASGKLVVTSRTYNRSEEGSFGQFIAGFSEDEAIDTNSTGVLLQLRSDAAFRSNVGIANLGGQAIEVLAKYYSGDLRHLGTKVYTVYPFSHFQANDVVPEENIVGGFAILESENQGARFIAYASVVDNQTGDPVYIPASKVEQ